MPHTKWLVSPSLLTILPKIYLVFPSNVFDKFTWRRKKNWIIESLNQLWFYEPLLAFPKLWKFLSTSLNLIFVSLTHYHLSNLLKVEQVLMVTIKPLSHQFFPLKKGTKDCQTGNPKSRLWKLFHCELIFCFAILSSNLSHRFMHLLRCFIHLLTFTVSETSSVYGDAAFRVGMLYNLSLSVWFITPCRRYCNTSLFFFWSSISNNDDVIVVRKKWDSTQFCLAEIGLVIDIIPKCSRVRPFWVLKKDFPFHLIPNHPFWKSECTCGYVLGSFVNES